jgi:uncharacterized membrane protein
MNSDRTARSHEQGGSVRFPPNGPRIEQYARHDSNWEWIGHLLSLLVVAALIALVVIVVMRLMGRTSLGPPAAASAAPVAAASSSPNDPALAQLRLRYANGEIERDDYLRMASDLGASVPSPEPSSPPATSA